MSQTNRSLTSTFPLLISVQELKLTPLLKFLCFFMVLIIFSLLAVLVYQINIYTSEIYFIHNAEKETIQLSQENKNLEITLARANSLLNAENYVRNFEEISRMEYVRVLEDTALAR